MKNICLAITLLTSLLTMVIYAQDEEYKGMSGTEKPVFSNFSDTTSCFVFRKYIIKTAQSEDGGENISVYQRGTTASGESACKIVGNKYQYIKDADNNNFYGLFGDHIFIDSGTSVESRGLEIYNLTSGRSLTVEYTDDPKLLDGRYVVFDSPSERKGPLATCKEAAKWKRSGGGVGWVQGKKLDLQTLKATNVGGLRCVYMQ